MNCFVLHADSSLGQNLIEGLLANNNTVTAFCYNPKVIRVYPHPKLKLKVFDEWDTHAVEAACQDNQMFFWNLEAPLRARIDFDLRFLPTTLQCLKFQGKRFLFFGEKPDTKKNSSGRQIESSTRTSDLGLQESIEEEVLRASALGIETHIIHTSSSVTRNVVQPLLQQLLKPHLALRRITISSSDFNAAQDLFRPNGL